MSRPKNRPWVPRLRFPEFRDAGAWEAKEIQECLEYERPDRFIVNSDNYHQSGTPVLTANQSFILGYTNEHDGICNHLPAVIFVDFTTDMKYVDFPFKVKSSAIKILRTKEDNNLSFLYELIYRMPFDASQHKRHYISEYQHQVIRLPHPREQNKIAACLSSLDALITTLSRKIDTLKEHKKGLMQQLFPQEGETVPQLRFPEFRDAGDWQSKQMEDLYSFLPTNSYSREKLNYSEGQVKNIHYGDIHTQFSTHFDIESEIVPFLNPSESLERIRPESYCVEGDLILADASEDLSDVGKCIEVVRLKGEKLISGLHTILARQKYGDLVIGFGAHLFKSNLVRTQVMKEAHGTKVVGISAGRLSKIKVCFPLEQREQQKIADCLSSLDELISAQSQRLDSIKTHKKGLMQQLFPTVAEATP